MLDLLYQPESGSRIAQIARIGFFDSLVRPVPGCFTKMGLSNESKSNPCNLCNP
jgi:hypothetical protein